MEVNWYCWVTVISLVTNFHGCLCWPTLQPPVRPVTSKHELDSDESRKVLGSSVVTSVSVIMDHGNGTKTFLTDGIENPELKTNIIGSPGNLLNPDKYEFYTFDETGDLVKRLMTWDEIQGLIAGSDGDGILGEASMPMYYSDAIPEKMGSTHITANDFQTSDIQGVHKVVESVQNVLKSELAASQSKIPPIIKPAFLSNPPNWSLFLPTILDNAEDGGDMNSLPGMLVSPSMRHPSITNSNTFPSVASSQNTIDSANITQLPTTIFFVEHNTTSTPMKEYTKKTEKPTRYKVTTPKLSTSIKNSFSPPLKTSTRPTVDSSWPTSTFASSTSKKIFSTSKYGGYSSNNDRWFTPATDVGSTPKKTFTSLKYGIHSSNEVPTSLSVSSVTSPSSTAKTSVFTYGDYSSTDEYGWSSFTTETPLTSRKASTTSKYGGPTTNNELFASIASVLHQVTDGIKPTVPSSTVNTTLADKTTFTYQYKTPTEANRFPSSNKIVSINQFKTSTEQTKSSTADNYKNIFTTQHRPFFEPAKSTSNNSHKTTGSYQYKFSVEPTRYTYSPENQKTVSTSQYKLSTESSRYTPDKISSIFQHKPFTDINIRTTSENYKTVSMFHKPSTDSYKYTTAGSNKIMSTFPPKFSAEPNKFLTSEKVSSYLYKTSTDATRQPTNETPIRKPTTNYIPNEIFSTIEKVESNPVSSKFNFTDEKKYSQDAGSDLSSSSSAFIQKETLKTTKTYESSTQVSTGYVTLQKQPLTVKPLKNKTTFSKIPSKPFEYTQSIANVTLPQNSAFISSVTEKPLIRVSTLKTSTLEQMTTRPEPLVTWISTFPLEETPSKVALNGVYDSDKLVTEQYVSSNHNKHPIIEELFKNVSATTAAATSTVKEPLYIPVSTETTVADNRQSTKESNKASLTSSLNNVPSGYTKEALSSSFEFSRPFRTSEKPEHAIESQTELTGSSTIPHRSTINLIHAATSDWPDTKPFKTTSSITGTSTTTTTASKSPIQQQSTGHNYSSSETVMQRIPTINPPNKSHSSTGSKPSTKPQYVSTESLKNITQIAVMLNKSNETFNKNAIKSEYRNKVTGKPTFESTKPINALFINDCITSLISNSLQENHTTESSSTETISTQNSKLTQPDEKENSHIYYYKLPPITSPQDTLIHFYKPAHVTAAETMYYKPETANTWVKATTEKEYQKITTVNHPSNDVLQDGISAVTNILLQTEGRVPNKEFTEFDANSSTPVRETTENMLRTDQYETPTKNTTAFNNTEDTTPSFSATYRGVNQSIENLMSSLTTNADNTTESEYFEMTSIYSAGTEKQSNETDLTTVEMGTSDGSDLTTAPATTNIGFDFRNEYVLDDRNITQEEEEDVKNYHPYNFTLVNRSGNGFKNVSNSSTPNVAPLYTEVVKFKNTTSTKTVIDKGTITKPSTDKIETKIPPSNNTRSTTASTLTNTTKNTTIVEYVEVKLENKTKAENKSEVPQTTPPLSAFRSPSNPTPRLPTSTPNPGVELHPAPHESMGLEASTAYLGDDVKRFIDFCNELSFKIWNTQTGKSLVTSRSIVLSPFAVLSTLAMIFLGARGSSSGIMNDFLRLDDMVTFNPHQVFQNVTESMVNSKNIGVANAAFVREVFSDKTKGKILDFYKERLQQYYDTHVEEIAFNIIGDLLRRRTNLLVKRQTQGRIQDYLKGSALVLKPPLAVLTANIFQTDCDVASTEGRDGEMYFVVRPSTRQRRLVPIPAVVYRNGFLAGYEPGLDATAVTLNPESIVSTILVLPGQQGQVAPGDGLARLEQRLLESSYRRGAWSRLLRSLLFRPGLELQIPRFSHKSVLNLTAGLQKMGMGEIFTSDKADLRGINGLSNELHLSEIVQVNTFSTCGEETVGARHHIETYPSSPQRVGRTNDIFDRSFLDDSVNNYYSSLPLNLRPRQARLPDNPRLRFDRPFLYIVRHNPTGLILYIGRFNPRLLP